MSDKSYRNHEPDLKLAGLSLWVWGREFPADDDYWDGNWLNVDARIEASGAVVRTSGTFLRTTDIEHFVQQLEQLYENVGGTAALDCLEPKLSIKVTCSKLGGVEVVVDITPDHMTQRHQFILSIDQSYLPETISGCRQILERFPVKGTP